MKKDIFLMSVYAFLIFLGLPANIWAQDYIIGPDDVLKISVYREEDMNREVRISSDGYISFPLLGKVKVVGMTVPELENNLTEGLKKYLKNPQVTAFIQEYSTITVSGQIKNPGSFPLRGEMSVLEAISIAGGFTKIAAQNAVKVMRLEEGEKKTIMVRVADISKTGDKSKDVFLKRGDIVFVPESLF
jgi:polysaccharide export outer membrane protein